MSGFAFPSAGCPRKATTRLYVDVAGRLNQAVACVARRVTIVAAGLPLEIEGGLRLSRIGMRRLIPDA